MGCLGVNCAGEEEVMRRKSQWILPRFAGGPESANQIAILVSMAS
jgi:hypothetical protein